MRNLARATQLRTTPAVSLLDDWPLSLRPTAATAGAPCMGPAQDTVWCLGETLGSVAATPIMAAIEVLQVGVQLAVDLGLRLGELATAQEPPSVRVAPPAAAARMVAASRSSSAVHHWHRYQGQRTLCTPLPPLGLRLRRLCRSPRSVHRLLAVECLHRQAAGSHAPGTTSASQCSHSDGTRCTLPKGLDWRRPVPGIAVKRADKVAADFKASWAAPLQNEEGQVAVQLLGGAFSSWSSWADSIRPAQAGCLMSGREHSVQWGILC